MVHSRGAGGRTIRRRRASSADFFTASHARAGFFLPGRGLFRCPRKHRRRKFIVHRQQNRRYFEFCCPWTTEFVKIPAVGAGPARRPVALPVRSPAAPDPSLRAAGKIVREGRACFILYVERESGKVLRMVLRIGREVGSREYFTPGKPPFRTGMICFHTSGRPDAWLFRPGTVYLPADGPTVVIMNHRYVYVGDCGRGVRPVSE